MRISLLHATYRREESPVVVKQAWLDRAVRPDRVEHLFALDADDLATLASTAGHHRIVSPPMPGMVTAVRNWNAAARESTGDVLVVIADDLFPPNDWDAAIESIIGPLDPRAVAFAVKVTDSPRIDDRLMRHPVVSRKFYEEIGLFSDRFQGVFCDDDITLRAFWHASILDGRQLVLEHLHPRLSDVPASVSQDRINAIEQYRVGEAALVDNWPARRRQVQIRLVRPQARRSLNARRLSWIQRRLRIHSMTTYVAHRSRQKSRSVLRRFGLLHPLRSVIRRIHPSPGSKSDR